MEIIHLVLGKVNPQRMNGVNKVVYELATRQHNAGVNVQVWGITANPVHDYPTRNFETRLFKAGNNPFAIDASLRKAMIEMPDDSVVHMHGGFIPVFYTAARLLEKVGVPVVFTPHGSYNTIALKKGGWKKWLYLPFFEKALLKRIQLVHSLGSSEVTGLHQLMDQKASVLIPYGFEAEQQDNTISHANMPAAKEDAFVVSFCGRIDIHTKGLDVLMEAFGVFAVGKTDVKLWIIGDSKQKSNLAAMASQCKVQDKVLFLGAKYGNEKMYWLQQSTVFAHPSRNEGLPTAVLEAASIGLPCLVSRATNMGEAIEENGAGWVIENTEATQMKTALEEAYAAWKSGALLQVGKNASAMVQQSFNWKVILEKFDTMYQSCLH